MDLDPIRCRCCLKASETNKNMLSDFLNITTMAGEVQNLLIQTCFLNVCPEISLLVEKTSHICTTCVDRLKTAYEFRQECLKSDASFAEREADIILVPKVEQEIKQEDEVEPQLDESSEYPTVFVKELDANSDEENKKEPRKRKYRSKRATRVKKPKSDDDCNESQDLTEEHKATTDELFEATYVCYYCDDLLTTHTEFLQHREMHRTPGEWAIKRICNLCAVEVKDYVKHLQEVHVEHRPNVCNQCNKTFVVQRELKNHLLVHSDYKNYKCQSCSLAFKSLKAFQNHILSKPNHLYYCIFCGGAENKINNILQHVQEKHPENRNKLMLPCYKCKKVFLTFPALDGHKCPDLKLEPAAGSSYDCAECQERLANEEQLECHRMVCANRRNGNLHFCHICQREFETARKLTKHKSNVHTRNSHQCDICGAQSATRNGLKTHKLIHTEERPYTCDLPDCTSAFKTKNNLVKHKETHNERNFECYHCAKRFPTYLYIRSHMATHCDDLKLYRCTMCSSAFNSKYQLDAHVASHREQKLFECKLCSDVVYSRRSSLRLHIKAVHDLIGFVCKFCDHWFAQSHQLIDHVFSHRGYKPYNCSMCSNGYVRKSKFKVHLRTHNIVYNEEIHGFKETRKSILMSGIKVTKGEIQRLKNV